MVALPGLPRPAGSPHHSAS